MAWLREIRASDRPSASDGVAEGRRGSLWFACVVALVAITLLMTGCGSTTLPALGLVDGTVTLEGVPLPAALVVFTPDGPGRSATAMTDTGGRYALAYLRDIPGANLGNHTVRITTATGTRGSREILPSRYHRRTELRATVQAGSNTIDFDLRRK